jgi:cytoskeletal protein RodZ
MRLAQYRHLLIPLATLLSAFIGSQVAADATGRVFTCHESNESQWQMTQPQEHADAGYFPTWTDCLAWRNGDPGPEYIWSYGQTIPTTTTTVEATTTTEAATTTTEVSPTEPPTTTTTTTTTTTVPATTTTTVAPTTTYQPTTSAPIPTTTQTTATTIETTTSVATSTTVPETTTTTSTSVPSDPRVRQAAAVIKAELAPGVTPQQAQTVLVISAVTTAFTSTRKNKQ